MSEPTTANATEKLTIALVDRNGAKHSTFRDNHRLVLPLDEIRTALEVAKRDFGFEMLIDITAIDYLERPGATERFGVVYCLANYAQNTRVILKTHVSPPDPSLPTVTDLWQSANWMEREVYDMFGIRFVGHPDPRRILMPDEFDGFPLRKDFPLKGRGERHNFPVLTRAQS